MNATEQAGNALPPRPPRPIPEGIPDEMKGYRRWVVSRYTTQNGIWSKPPLRARDGLPASTNRPADLATFDEAWAAYCDPANYLDFLGFAPGPDDPYFAVDEDGCVVTEADEETGEAVETILPFAQRDLDLFASHAEYSPSRLGIRIIGRGKLRDENGAVLTKLVTEQAGPHAKCKTEVFIGSNWFSVTGHLVPGEPMAVHDRQHELEAYHGEWKRSREGPADARAAPAGGIGWSDEDVIKLSESGAGGWSAVRFRRLYYEADLAECRGDHSAGDYRLCLRLAFLIGRDIDQIDRLFRRSALFRADKWDSRRGSSTYGRRTIERALARFGDQDYFNPWDGAKLPEGVKVPPRPGGVGVEGTPPQAGADDEGRETQAEALLRLAEVAELFRTPDARLYATVPVGARSEHHPIRSTSFRRWLVRRYYGEKGRPPGSEPLQQALGVLEARAEYDGPTHPVFVRVAEAPDTTAEAPAYYLDLADNAWRAVRVTPGGWEVVARPPVRFRRARGMLPLPEPVRGGDLAELEPFLNVGKDGHGGRLLIATLTADLRPRGPYPILVLTGEQGSAKSTATRVKRRLIDPHVTLLRSEPRDGRDLMIAASNSWVLALDNLSHISGWLSDALCRLSTGGGFATRALYQDDEEVFFEAMRPVALNGIGDVASRGDLIDRCVVLHLPAIDEVARKEEAPFWRAFDAAHPRILGALLDAVCGGLRELPRVELDRLPRMADFARWGEAVGRALGWPAGAFLEAYAENRAGAAGIVLEDSPVASELMRFMEGRAEYRGTASDLLAALGDQATDTLKVSKAWPRSARGLSGILRREAPALRTVNLSVTFDRQPSGNRTRLIAVEHIRTKKEPQPSPSSPREDAASAEASNPNSVKGLRAESTGDGADLHPSRQPSPPPPRPSLTPAEGGTVGTEPDADDTDRPPDRPHPDLSRNGCFLNGFRGGVPADQDAGDGRDGSGPPPISEPTPAGRRRVRL